MEAIYKGQFLSPRKRDGLPFDDGRHLLDATLRKIHRRGPTAPDTLAKRAAPDAANDSAIRNIAKTSAQLRFESHADEALSVIRKCLSRPSGAGPFMPEPERTSDPGRRVISERDMARIAARVHLRKGDARTPALIDSLPRGDSDGAYVDASPTRAGGTASATDGYSSTAMPAGGISRPYGASAAAVTSGRAGPEDNDLDGKRKKRRKHHARDDSSASIDTNADDDDQDDDMDDDDDDDSADFALKAIKRAHRAGPRRGW